MTNPSQVIHDIVQQYSTDTMASLHVLVREADVYREQAFKDAMSMVPIDTETEVATSLVNLTSPRVSQEAPAPEVSASYVVNQHHTNDNDSAQLFRLRMDKRGPNSISPRRR